MLLTVGIINLLSHVSTLVMGGGDPALYLNKMLQSIEVVRPLIGESNTSVFQQQQFKMLLSGSGEGGGIASPVTPRGSGGRSGEELPRGSKQSMPDSVEQSSVSHLSKIPSKRTRSSFDETSVAGAQGVKKPRLSNYQIDLAQESPEEQEGTSPRSSKLNLSQDSSSGGSASQGGHDKVRASSKQVSQEVQETPSFDDLLTQAIQAISPQDFSPAKESIQTQVQTQPSELTPTTEERTTKASASATVPTSQPAPSVTRESMETETVSASTTESMLQPAPSVTRESMEIDTVSASTTESILQPAPSVTRKSMETDTVSESIAQPVPSTSTAATGTKVVSFESTIQAAPSLVIAATETITLSDSTTVSTSQTAPSMTTVLTEMETVSDAVIEATSQPALSVITASAETTTVSISPSASTDQTAPSTQTVPVEKIATNNESTTIQVVPTLISESVEMDESEKELISAATKAMKKFKDLFTLFNNKPESEDVEAASSLKPASADSTFKQSTSQPAPSETTESMETETTATSTKESTTQSPSASADPDRQEHQRKMGSVAEQLKEQFNRRQASSNQNTQSSEEAKSEESKSDPSASADPTLQQQRRSMFDELKGFQFNKGQKKKSQAKQKPEEQKKSMVDELKERFKRKPGATTATKAGSSETDSMPGTSASVDSGGKFATSTRRDNSLKRAAPTDKKPTFESQLKEAIFKGISGLRPTPKKEVQVQEKTPSTPKPQKPVGMKRSVLGKKSPLAKVQEESMSDRIHKLELDKKKMEQNIEWQKQYNPKFHAFIPLRELKELEKKISELKIQMGKEKKAIQPIGQSVASSHPTIPVAQNLLPEIKNNSADQSTASLSSSSLASSSISTSLDDLLPEIKGSSTDQGITPSLSLPSLLISTSLDTLLAEVEAGVELRATSAPVKQEEQKTDLEKHRDSRLAAIRKAADAEDNLDDEPDDGEDWGPKTTIPSVTPVRQPAFKVKPSLSIPSIPVNVDMRKRSPSVSSVASSVDTPPVSTPAKTLSKPISEDSPARRAVLARLKASPQAASTPSLFEQIKQRKLLSTVAVAPQEEKKEKNVLIRTLSTVADFMFSKPGRSNDPEPKGEKQKLPLGSSDGWAAEDDEWDED